MVSLGHGTLSFKGYVPERRWSSSGDYGKKALKKKRWEVKIKLSQYNPRKPELATIEVSTLTKRETLEILEICLSKFAIHVMKENTLLEIILETKVALIRRRETREDIMLMVQRIVTERNSYGLGYHNRQL